MIQLRRLHLLTGSALALLAVGALGQDPGQIPVQAAPEIQRLDPAARIRVTVVAAESGQSIREARVALLPEGPTTSRVPTNVSGTEGSEGEAPLTGEQGHATLRIGRAGSWRLVTTLRFVGSRWGFESSPAKLAKTETRIGRLLPGEDREVLVELTTGFEQAFHARAVAKDSGRSIGGATVAVLVDRKWSDGEEAWPNHSVFSTTQTDPLGSFELALPPSWQLSGRVEAEGFASAYFPIESGHETPDQALTIELEYPASLSGVVTDAGGASIAGATVRLTVASSQIRIIPRMILHGEWSAETGGDGAYRFLDLPLNVKLDVSILRGGDAILRDPVPILLEPGEARAQDWCVGCGAALVGQVLVEPGGAPIAGQRVALRPAGPVWRQSDRYTVTDAAGRFRFEDLLPGRWVVALEVPPNRTGPQMDDAVASVSETVTVEAGVPEYKVVLTTYRGLYIRGVVLNPKDRPQAHIKVRAIGLPGYSAPRETGRDGAFSLGPLLPGEYSVLASPRKYASPPQVRVTAGKDDVIIRLQPGSTFAGIVVDAESGERCLDETSIEIIDESVRNWMKSTNTSDGQFDVDRLQPGAHTIVATTKDGRAGRLRVSVAPGEDARGLVVAVRAGARLLVRSTDEEQRHYVQVRMDGVVVESTYIQGHRVLTLPEGKATVALQIGFGENSRTLEQQVALASGIEREVVFDVRQ